MKNNWSLLNQGNTIRILLLMIFIIDVHPLLSNPLCYQMYQDHHLESNLSALSPILSSTAKLFGIPTAEQAKIVRSYSDRSLSDIRNEVKAKEEVIEQVRKLPSERLAELKEVVQKLIESGFLLSPFHEILFLNSIGLNTDKIHKTDLNSFSFSLHGTKEEDLLYRHKVARRMVEQLNWEAIQIGQWRTLSSSSQYNAALAFTKFYKLNVKIPDLIKILNSLSNLHNSGKNEILLQVFELTLPDIFTVSRARAAGLITDKSAFWLIPSVVGGASSLLGDPAGFSFAAGLMGFTAAFAPNFFAGVINGDFLPITRFTGNTKAFVVRSWKKRSIEGRMLLKAEAEISSAVAEEAKLSDLDDRHDRQNNQQDARLDQHFNAIKLELKNRKLQGPIEISKWGSEFQNGITNLVERGQLLSSRVKKASENSKELQTEPLSDVTSASQRNQLRSSLNSQINFINDSLVVAFGMKADLLSLSAALDRYNELASQVNERTLSSSETNILELTARNLSSYKTQISALASLLVSSEQAMINELNIAQMNLLGINDERLINSF